MAFTWQSVGHAFASLFKEIVTVSTKVSGVLTQVQSEAPLVEALTGLVSPSASAVESIAFGALGELVAAVHGVEQASSANGINVAFDGSVVAEVRKIIADYPQIVSQIEAYFKTKP